jgi:hypothetical protein|tara:strand:- start:228 stop:755 length:528 start_codon:yes stop_codon:yes gene_type:complete
MGQRLTDRAALEQQTGSGDLLMVVDVNDTQGSPEGTSKQMDFKYLIQTDKFSLNNTEVQALHTTSKTLVSALSGYMVTPISATLLCTYAASTESSSNNLYFGYDDSSDSSYWFQIRDVMNGKSTDMTYVQSAYFAAGGTCTTSILNKPFLMWTNAALNGGWSCDVYLTYAYTKIL